MGSTVRMMIVNEVSTRANPSWWPSPSGFGIFHEGYRTVRNPQSDRAAFPRPQVPLGLLVSDLIDDRIVTRTMDVDGADIAMLNGLFDEMEQSAHASLRNEGLADTDIAIQRLIDLRFRHQMHEMPVPIAAGVITPETIKTVESRFRKLYAEAYSVESNDPAQIVNIRVHAVGHVPQPDLAPAPPRRLQSSAGR